MIDERVESILSKMTLKEKLGQLILAGFPSDYYDEHVRTLIEDYKVGNIIIFSRNFKDLKQMKELNLKIYQEVVKNTGLVPFIAADQEGGSVVRINKGVAFPPMAMTTSASYPHASGDAGRIIGEELIKLGINLNLAPVVDVGTDLSDSVMTVRTFSDNPEKVKECGLDFINGLKRSGVVGCLKHFPGFGKSNVDSHLGLPINDEPLEYVLRHNLYPYHFVNDAKMIMCGHLIYTEIDKDFPASISKPSYKILREELGFDGIAITDCLEMAAIAEYYGTENGASLAIQAGADMLCICHTLSRQVGALKKIEEDINAGIIKMEDIDKRVKKIIKVKLMTEDALNDCFLNGNIDMDPNNDLIFQSIVDMSITKVKGQINFEKDALILAPLMVNYSKVEDYNLYDNLASAINRNLEGYHTEIMYPDNHDKLIELAEKYKHIIIFTYVGPTTHWEVDLVNELAQNKRVDVFSLKGPYDYYMYDGIRKYMCVYEYSTHSNNSIIKYIKGELEPQGILPVKLSR